MCNGCVRLAADEWGRTPFEKQAVQGTSPKTVDVEVEAQTRETTPGTPG